MSLNNFFAALAQLVEQLICNQWVGSSNLSSGTTFSPTKGFTANMLYKVFVTQIPLSDKLNDKTIMDCFFDTSLGIIAI